MIEHHFHVMRGVPVAVVVEVAGLFQHAGELDAPRPHVVDVGLGALVSVFKGALLLGPVPEDFVVAVGVEGRVGSPISRPPLVPYTTASEIDAGGREFSQLSEIVAAIDDARVHER